MGIYTNGKRTIKVTETAYELIYKKEGFMPISEKKVDKETERKKGKK